MRGERERERRILEEDFQECTATFVLEPPLVDVSSFFLSTGRLFLAGDVRDAIKFSPHIIRGSIVKFCEKKERGEAGKRERERRREGHGL